MTIQIYNIQKVAEFGDTIEQYRKMSAKYAKIEDVTLFDARVARAQSAGREQAQKSYDEIYLNKIGGYCVALDERGEMLDSLGFAKLLSDKSVVKFFVGGAFGLSQNFKNACDRVVSLSRLTMAHKIAKVVLYEQIYRALSINANHPYHK